MRLVSISDEKPLHMRHSDTSRLHRWKQGFNLRREAAPHATLCHCTIRLCDDWFQSQTRSRSTCDMAPHPVLPREIHVSISDEKPLHMRRSSFYANKLQIVRFNLRREAAPHATSKPPVSVWQAHGFNLRREAAPHA